MKKLVLISAIVGLVLSTGCRQADSDSPTLTLYVAASLTDVIREIGDSFAERENVEMVYNFAGSGALAQQLIASPRADVYFSASIRWMEEVVDAGRIEPGQAWDFLSNELVIIGNRRTDYSIGDPQDLATGPFELLAIGDPEFVPAGFYARQWMQGERLPSGDSLWDRMRDRISPAPDVRAALSQVQGSTEVVGIVYRTDYQWMADRVKLLYSIPVSSTPDIVYQLGLLRGAGQRQVVKAFVAYLERPETQGIFEKYGFLPLRNIPD